jgi:hypothetical protein
VCRCPQHLGDVLRVGAGHRARVDRPRDRVDQDLQARVPCATSSADGSNSGTGRANITV